MRRSALPLSFQELATLIAALRYWRDEMLPHGNEVPRPYFEGLEADPPTADELERLLERLLREAGRAESGGEGR